MAANETRRSAADTAARQLATHTEDPYSNSQPSRRLLAGCKLLSWYPSSRAPTAVNKGQERGDRRSLRRSR